MMELVKRRKRLTEAETQYYMWQLLNVTEYLHQNNVIHRDLKLGNLFLDDKMNIKVGDFGLSAKLESKGSIRTTLCGTPNYIAPEVLNNGSKGHSFEVDIWSIGVIMYTLLFGKPPFQSENIDNTYQRIKDNRYVFPQHVKVSGAAKSLIKSILHTRPEMRPTIEQIRQSPFFTHTPFPSKMPSWTLTCRPNYIIQGNRGVLTKTSTQKGYTTTGDLRLDYETGHDLYGNDKRSSLHNQRDPIDNNKENATAARSNRVPLGVRQAPIPKGKTPATSGVVAEDDNAIAKGMMRMKLAGKNGTTSTTSTTKNAVHRRQGTESAATSPVPRSAFAGPAIGNDENKYRFTNLRRTVSSSEVLTSSAVDSIPTMKSNHSRSSSASSPQKRYGSLNSGIKRSMSGLSGMSALSGLPMVTESATNNSEQSSVTRSAQEFIKSADDVAVLKRVHDDIESSFQGGSSSRKKSSSPTSYKNREGGVTRADGSSPSTAGVLGQKKRAVYTTPKDIYATESKTDAASRRVLSWVDYSNKYGIGYLLNNGVTGVYFNDASKIVLHANAHDFLYFPEKGHPTYNSGVPRHFTMSSYPEDLKKKQTLLTHFSKYLLNHHEADIAAGKAEVLDQCHEVFSETGPTPVFVRKWLQTKHAIIFRLSNRTVQVVFNDKTELTISSEFQTVTFKDKKQERETFPLASVFDVPRPELESRMRYTKEVLSNLTMSPSSLTSRAKPMTNRNTTNDENAHNFQAMV